MFFSLILPGVHQLQVPGSDFVVVISDVVVVVSDADIDEVAANFRSIEVFWVIAGSGYFNWDGLSNSKKGSFRSEPNVDVVVVDVVALDVVVFDLDLCAIHWSQLKAPPLVVSSKMRTFQDEKWWRFA